MRRLPFWKADLGPARPGVDHLQGAGLPGQRPPHRARRPRRPPRARGSRPRRGF